MRFNLLLREAGLDPASTAIILHTPKPPRLRMWLPYIAAERHDLFEAYQSVHSPGVEATLANRTHAASFVRLADGTQCLAGVYRIASSDNRATREIYADPRFAELETHFGATDTAPQHNIQRAPTQRLFVLERMDALSGLRGRLRISMPPGRTYIRIAANLDPEVIEITRVPHLVPAPPEWDSFVVTGAELRVLPDGWAARLREWRGVYMILDETDGSRYVGSAYGMDNLLGRWRAHVAGDQGVTVELRRRDPSRFRFSILELVAPTAAADEAIRCESNWKLRLHTLEYGLNRR